jgi:hypothetical protein
MSFCAAAVHVTACFGCAQIMAPYAHWDIPAIGQAYMLFRARLLSPYSFSAGTESLDARLFAPKDIPFDQVLSSPCYYSFSHCTALR